MMNIIESQRMNYKDNSPEILQGLENRFVNIYYWVAKHQN